jgi:hypothetical protein
MVSAAELVLDLSSIFEFEGAHGRRISVVSARQH